MKKSLLTGSILALSMTMLMTGCRHRKVMVIEPTPPTKLVQPPMAVPRATMADMPSIPEPQPPNVVLGGTVAPAPRKHDSNRNQDQQTADNTQAGKLDANKNAAAGEEPPNTTPIGQLSASPNTQGLPNSSAIARQIQTIQQQLKGIKRALNPREQRTASQIRTFLSKATNALQAGDLDGANTLTVKARVLLSELQ
jgi:ribosomal protein S20